jgi:hypothetical protein
MTNLARETVPNTPCWYQLTEGDDEDKGNSRRVFRTPDVSGRSFLAEESGLLWDKSAAVMGLEYRVDL